MYTKKFMVVSIVASIGIAFSAFSQNSLNEITCSHHAPLPVSYIEIEGSLMDKMKNKYPNHKKFYIVHEDHQLKLLGRKIKKRIRDGYDLTFSP